MDTDSKQRKTCGTCFRYCEDWRDAEAKGLKNINKPGVTEYYHKPRPGIKVRAIGVNCPESEEMWSGHPACRFHMYRWAWNIRTWWEWHFKQAINGLFRKYIRVPIGGLRKPIPLEWQDYFDGMADRIMKNGEPVCPQCGEMPYSLEQCVFCGQRFIEEKQGELAEESELSDEAKKAIAELFEEEQI